MKKNDIINLDITDLPLSGSGVGHADGMAVFVPCTAAGDKISAHILKVKSKIAFAKVKDIIVPSLDRIDNDCPAFPRCGGCSFRHISYEAELRLKENQVRENFRRIGGLDVPVEAIIPAENTYHYRNKAQYPVAYEDGKLKIGFYAPRSHRIIECRSCLLQPVEFEQILDIIAEWVEKYRVPVYNESDGSGLLRHIYIRKSFNTGEVMVCIVCTKNSIPFESELVDALSSGVTGIKSVILNVNPDDTNVILGQKCRTLRGADHITCVLRSLKIEISPLSFLQVNSVQTEKLYAKAEEYAGLNGGETLLDLYCGAGTVGLSMAKNVKSLIGVEIVPEAVEDAVKNARRNSITNARFICADAAAAAEKLEKEGNLPDIIMIDPPRKGCSPELIELAARMRPKKIVYISCDSATLARDCAAFAKNGYKPVKAAPVDMFPRTGHVECVTLMTRK